MILGLTFKENCPDTRNSKVVDIINRLNEYEIEPILVDPYADPSEARQEYGVEIAPFDMINDADCLVFAVAHGMFRDMTMEQIDGLFGALPNEEKVIIVVKSILDKGEIEKYGYSYWRL